MHTTDQILTVKSYSVQLVHIFGCENDTPNDHTIVLICAIESIHP